MNCKACRVEIEETEQGTPLSSSADAHVESCSNCRAFRDEQATLRQMIGSLEVVAAPADFDFRLRARLASVKSEGHRGFIWNRFAPGAWSLALAASFVILIAAGLFYRVWLSPGMKEQSQQFVINAQPHNLVANPALYASSSVGVVPAKVDPSVEVSPDMIRRQETSKRDYREANIVQPPTGDDGIRSRDLTSISTAKSITPPGIYDPVTQPNAAVAVPVQASMKSASMVLEDKQAKPQNVSLRPVTFGGQAMIEQASAQKIFISTAQSIW
jgi:hypothetical protein